MIELSIILVSHCSKQNVNDQNEITKYNSFISGMLHLDVQLIVWSQAITPIADVVMLTNITAMLKSYQLEHYFYLCWPMLDFLCHSHIQFYLRQIHT